MGLIYTRTVSLVDWRESMWPWLQGMLEAAAEFGVKGLGEHELEVFCLLFLSATAMEKFVFVESRTWGPT